MIFVTVGGQLPFDRLVRTVDGWAAARARDDLEAQIGDGSFEPKQIAFKRYLSPTAFRNVAHRADAIVGHAGMGIILTALELGKPLLVMPRRAELDEHRNDHQLATAGYFGERGLILVARDEDELRVRLEEIEHWPAPPRIAMGATSDLVRRIREWGLDPERDGP